VVFWEKNENAFLSEIVVVRLKMNFCPLYAREVGGAKYTVFLLPLRILHTRQHKTPGGIIGTDPVIDTKMNELQKFLGNTLIVARLTLDQLVGDSNPCSPVFRLVRRRHRIVRIARS
jgi:hypothetical protein